MKLNVHFAINLDMQNLNAGANFSQKNKYPQVPRYGEERTYNVKVAAYIYLQKENKINGTLITDVQNT